MDNLHESAHTLTTAQASAARSSLGGVQHGSVNRVALSERPFMPSFDLRVAPHSNALSAVSEMLGIRLPTRVGETRSQQENQRHALCLGPDWWLILGPMDAAHLLEPMRADFHFSIVDVSAQRTLIEVEGPQARQVLEHLWEQDLRENYFPVGSCSQGAMNKAPTVLWHRKDLLYNIFVRSSFAAHLWASLADACVEYLET